VINGMTDDPHAPWGGFKYSGVGREDGRYGIEEIERNQIVAALERTRWVVAGSNGAAARLGMKPSTLQARMQKLGIVRNSRPIENATSNSSQF